jgi:hypothetical protein
MGTMLTRTDTKTFLSRWTRISPLAVLLIISIFLRLGIAFYLGDEVPPPIKAPDDTSYSYLAERWANGYGFSFDRPWYPFGKPAGYPTAHWSFLYTLYVGSIYTIFGPHPLAARLVGAVLGGILLPLMSYRLTRRLFPKQARVPLIAAACTAFYAFFIFYAARLMTETFFIVGLLWTLERGIALAERPTPGRAVTLGLALGITTLLRQSILPWVVLLFAWLLWVGWRSGYFWRMFRVLVMTGLVLILAILPFTVRNYIVYHDFLLLNSNAGFAMYSAQHPMHGTSFQEFAAAPFPPELRDQDLEEPQLDRELMSRGIGYVLDEPDRYLLLSLSRVRDYFEFWPTSDTTLLYNVGRVVSFALFLPFMLYGLFLALRRNGPFRTRADWIRFSTQPLALPLSFMIFYPLLHIFTWAMSRYRLPVDATALSFAALALDDLWARLQQRWAHLGSDINSGEMDKEDGDASRFGARA